ncbi:FAD dependent oxidoreductase-like protein superfamily [Westerdykella ornata]|uniref:FAD dependent oxidoreductase-like protein superfamily n=1 Tax=Westerdykella ornata TaxID=318751 RepID=A0A6A6JXZ1_WESOR|nr:FAD dependent oxidoreductase-like protein superfamily [Westerdykella ornata]KAF2281491.1 FAD dependent oxidoreductase-like protein superfamily [Westerdykella ornata]
MADTVILGSGIIGLSTAYYLSQSGNTPPERIHLVDPIADLFHCASGFAGGFLAADWFAPSVASLGALSFKLHKELADKHDGRKLWGYSASTGISYSQYSDEDAVGGSGEDWLFNGRSRAQAAAAAAAESQPKADQEGPVWLKRSEGATLEVISRDDSTAQLDPLKFCQFLLDECLKRGVKLHHPAKAVGVTRDEQNQLIGIKISQDGSETELPCSRLVLTTGAWTPRLFSTLFPDSNTCIPISALAGHSLLLKNPHFKDTATEEMCHAVFATDTLGFSPEFFSRSGGEVYLAGLNSMQIPLPEVPTDAKPNPEAIKKLTDCALAMMGTVEGKEVETTRESLCFRPVTSSGRPIVARIPDARLGGRLKTKPYGGVFMAAGHGAWGIAQSCGTGLCMAELIEGRKTSADISALGLP